MRPRLSNAQTNVSSAAAWMGFRIPKYIDHAPTPRCNGRTIQALLPYVKQNTSPAEQTPKQNRERLIHLRNSVSPP